MKNMTVKQTKETEKQRYKKWENKTKIERERAEGGRGGRVHGREMGKYRNWDFHIMPWKHFRICVLGLFSFDAPGMTSTPGISLYGCSEESLRGTLPSQHSCNGHGSSSRNILFEQSHTLEAHQHHMSRT